VKRKPLALKLLGVINPCYPHDPNGMSQPDDTTKNLSKHGGSLCYIPPCLSVDDLVEQEEQFLRQSEFERTTLLSDMSAFPSYPRDTNGDKQLPLTSWEVVSLITATTPYRGEPLALPRDGVPSGPWRFRHFAGQRHR
jgi:hypothetical protein